MNKRNYVIYMITQTLIWYGLFAIVTDVWRIMEHIFYNDVFPSAVDLVVGMILAISLYVNLMLISKKSVLIYKNPLDYPQKRGR